MRRGARTSKREARKAIRTAESALNQLVPQVLDNPYPPLCPLTSDQLEEIHNASIIVLESLGIEVTSDRVRSLFRSLGGSVDDATQIVRIDGETIMALIANAPHHFTLTPRNAANQLVIGGRRINCGLVSGPPNVHDRINGRRPGNFLDYQSLIKLGQTFNVINFFGNQSIAPTDLPANTRHLDTYRENIMLSDKVFSAVPIGKGRIQDAVRMVALSRGITTGELSEDPSLFGNININSPRKLDEAMSDAALELAHYGQAVIVTPFTLLGAMTPVTLAAGLVQQNAEALFGLAMIHNVDMRSGAPAFGTPENAKANLAGGQLARRYGLPYRTSGCNASNTTDAQAVYETQMSMWSAVLGHGNLLYHAAGWLEGGLVASFEKLIIDVEMLQNLISMLSPIRTSEEELGIDAIEAVAPGGHFFGTEHTMARYETAFYTPLVSDWQNNENWQAAGGKDATERATSIWQQAIETFEAPLIDGARREAIDEYVDRRKTQIGSSEP